MYSEQDLNEAVRSGAMTAEAAAALRAHVAGERSTPAVDEESFRLITGFNDIFVSIAIILMLVAVAWLGGSLGGRSPVAGVLGSAAVAAVSWGLAEYFTRQRRMALPSILLLITFVWSVAGAMIAAVATYEPDVELTGGGIIAAVVALLTAGAAWLHWRRFMVPITVAAGAGALAATVAALFVAAIPEAALKAVLMPVWFVLGLAMFAFAMWWDLSDRERRTRRSDVAFWLHLAAAPMIAHPVFDLIGVFGGDIGVVQAVAVLALYVAFAFVALAIDRRALLVSSLIYVLYALYALFAKAGAVEIGGALTALVIGSALLLLSAFWQRARALVVGSLGGGWAAKLPPVSDVTPRSA